MLLYSLTEKRFLDCKQTWLKHVLPCQKLKLTITRWEQAPPKLKLSFLSISISQQRSVCDVQGKISTCFILLCFHYCTKETYYFFILSCAVNYYIFKVFLF